jgi:hypothetical protein
LERFVAESPPHRFGQIIGNLLEETLHGSLQAIARKALVELRGENLRVFLSELETSLQRKIVRILVLALHGRTAISTTVDDAIAFIHEYDEGNSAKVFARYEIQIEYSNDDKIRCDFTEKRTAILFLKGLQ